MEIVKLDSAVWRVWRVWLDSLDPLLSGRAPSPATFLPTSSWLAATHYLRLPCALSSVASSFHTPYYTTCDFLDSSTPRQLRVNFNTISSHQDFFRRQYFSPHLVHASTRSHPQINYLSAYSVLLVHLQLLGSRTCASCRAHAQITSLRNQSQC